MRRGPGSAMRAVCAAASAMAMLAATSARALPSASEWAHEELTNHLSRIVGAAALPRFEMVLPGDAGAKQFAADFAALRDTDGYAVRRREENICFVADNPKGHVNGVHRWLERNFEIIWPRPMGDMCFFEKTGADALANADCDYRDVPAFRLRYLGGASSNKEVWRWNVRNATSSMSDVSRLSARDRVLAERYGMYGAFWDVFGGGHDMESRWFPRKEFFRDHPEYWMLVDGKRWEGPRSNFCETNPDFAAAYAKSVEEKIRGLPKSVRVISINMEDTTLTCQCDKCLAPIVLEDGTVVAKDDPAFKSTRFFIFFNKVARHVAKIRPDLRILQFAYMHLAIPPKVRVERNVTLKWCPYPRNMRESVTAGPSNANWKERLDGWLANTPEMYLREYYFCGCIYYPRPIADTAAVDLRYCRDRGMKEVYCDLAGKSGDNRGNNATYGLNRPWHEFFDMVGMESWVVGKLFWDPSLETEALRAQYLKRSFGPAAPDVAEFYRLLRDSWYSDAMASSFCDNPFRTAAHYIVKKGISDKCRAALAAAASKADNHERRAWLDDMRRILEDWIRDAPKYMKGEVNVPLVEANWDVGLDFDRGPWVEAAQLPPFTTIRGREAVDRSGSSVKVFSDGRAFCIGFDVRKDSAPWASPPDRKGAFPRGDKIEVSLSAGGQNYYQFATDCDGNRYDAKGMDSSWTCGWDLRIEKNEAGWKASVRIPFAAVGFAPHVNPRVYFLPMVTYAGDGLAGGKSKTFSWQGGVPHTPMTWGELVVAIEPLTNR